MKSPPPTFEAAEHFISLFAVDPAFAKRKLIQRLVRLLFDRWAHQQPGIHSDEVTDMIYGEKKKRSGGQDEPNIYNLKCTTNIMLRRFCSRADADFGFLVQVSRPPYELQFLDPSSPLSSPPEPFETDLRAGFENFWADYLSAHPSPIIVFTSPLFFRDKELRYVRDININSEIEQARLDSLLGPGKGSALTPNRNYYSAGEVNGVLRLLTEFLSRGIDMGYRVVGQADSLPEQHQRQLIALGSGRTNWYLDSRQADLAFVVNRSDVLDTETGTVYSDEPDKLGRLAKYAVLTRCPGNHIGLTVTMIAANHGRAAEGVAEYIVRDKELGELVQTIASGGSFPSTFQAIFRVTVQPGLESEILRTEVVKTWRPSSSS